MAPINSRGVDTLLKEIGDDLFHLCCHLTHHDQDAEDLMQEVLLEVHQDLHQFQGRSALLTWIFRIAIRRWTRLKRRRFREIEATRLTEPAATASYPTAEDLDRMTIGRVLDEMPEELRLPFQLVKVHGLKYREVSELLGVPQGTVQSRVHDAGRRITSELAEASDEGVLRARAWLAERRLQLDAA